MKRKCQQEYPNLKTNDPALFLHTGPAGIDPSNWLPDKFL